MRFEAPAHERSRRPRETVVPLINVVFLLVIFFMLAGTLQAPQPFDVELPSAATRGEPAPIEARFIALARSGDLALDGVPIAPGALGPALGKSPPRRLSLRADGRAPASATIPLLRRLAALGVEEVDLMTVDAH